MFGRSAGDGSVGSAAPIGQRNQRAGGTFLGALPLMSYSISDDGGSIMCLECGRISIHPADVKNRYCPRCHVFHEDEELSLLVKTIEKARTESA